MLIRVVVFYVLTLVFTVVLGGVQQAAAISTNSAILPQLAPGLAALLMLLILRKDRHQFTIVARRTPVARYALAALIPLGGGLLVLLIHRLLFAADSAAPAAAPWALLLWFPIGALGEELGWRGYLHKRLDGRLAGLASSLVVGVLWALWHVGMYQNGPLFMAFFALLMVSYSVVIYALVADAGFSVLLATIFHLMINITSLLAYSVVNQISFMAVNSLLWALIAIVVILARRPIFAARARA